MQQYIKSLRSFFTLFKAALKGEEDDYTQVSVRRAIFLLSVPMILEMVMESLFAVVDIFFVGQIGVDAVATVGLTESVITIVYSVSIGVSMAATAIVSRRVGEKKPNEASNAAFQAILVGSIISIIIGVLGFTFAKNILSMMGGSKELVENGYRYTQIIFLGNLGIMLLFLINGIFRGAGNAAIAMRSLWLANGLNLVLDPILIFGLGPIPAFGLEGAAIATTTGRTIGVCYQVWMLLGGYSIIKIARKNLVVHLETLKNILKISSGGMSQFMIESASWVFLTRLVSEFGSEVVAGYTISFRIVIFTLLPSWGMSNAAATLVGQNLGAGRADRAEQSVWQTAKYNVIFLGIVSVIFFIMGEAFVSIFTKEAVVIDIGATALKIFCLGYIFFAFGMVVSQSFNGAGDTKTPTIINFAVFWVIQLPLAYLLAVTFSLDSMGIFITIAISHSIHAIVSTFFFRKGTWKTMKV